MEGKERIDSPHDCGCGWLFFGLCRLDTRLNLSPRMSVMMLEMRGMSLKDGLTCRVDCLNLGMRRRRKFGS